MVADPTLFTMSLNAIRVRLAGEDGLFDGDAEWRLTTEFGAETFAPIFDRVPLGRHSLRDNSVERGDVFSRDEAPLAEVDIPAGLFMDSNGDFNFNDFFVRSRGREVDGLNPDDDLPRINEELDFSLSDREFTLRAGPGRTEFAYSADFRIVSPIDALVVGDGGDNDLVLGETDQSVLLAGQGGTDGLVGSRGDDFFFGGERQ